MITGPRTGGTDGRNGWRVPAALAASVAALGMAAIANRAMTERAERLHPPHGRLRTVDGVRLHHLEAGRGPPVLLLHGNGAMAEDMAASGLLDRVARDGRAIVPDRPGYGFSDRPGGEAWTPERQAHLLGHLLDVLGIVRPVVVGHSWGTLVALALALERPVAGLVLLSGYYYPTPRADVALMSGPAMPILGDVLANTLSPPIARALWPALCRKVFGPLPVPRRFAERFPRELALRPHSLRASASEAALMIPAAARLAERYGELLMPVVIMGGDADRIVETEHQSGRLHREVASSSLIVAPGVGHMIHYAEPQAIAAAVAALSRA